MNPVQSDQKTINKKDGVGRGGQESKEEEKKKRREEEEKRRRRKRTRASVIQQCLLLETQNRILKVEREERELLASLIRAQDSSVDVAVDENR